MVITSDSESFEGLLRFLVPSSNFWNFGTKSRQKSSIEQNILVILVADNIDRKFSYLVDFQ